MRHAIRSLLNAPGFSLLVIYKSALGHAVLEEVVREPLLAAYMAPIEADRADPLGALQRVLRRRADDFEAGGIELGCPLNNLAQEMSPLDENFRRRIDALYLGWRNGFAAALADGIAEGTVHSSVDPRAAASFIVAAQMGIWGTGKVSQDEALMMQAGEAICAYLETLRA